MGAPTKIGNRRKVTDEHLQSGLGRATEQLARTVVVWPAASAAREAQPSGTVGHELRCAKLAPVMGFKKESVVILLLVATSAA